MECEISSRQVAGLDVHESDDGLIVFAVGADRLHHLNSSASLLFALCKQAQPRAALIDAFRDTCGLDRFVEAAVQDALDRLVAEGLLVSVGGR
jgi:hypothetical protein